MVVMERREFESRGRSSQIFCPGFFIKDYLATIPEQTAYPDAPDRTSYPEAVHAAYRRAFRELTQEQVIELLGNASAVIALGLTFEDAGALPEDMAYTPEQLQELPEDARAVVQRRLQQLYSRLQRWRTPDGRIVYCFTTKPRLGHPPHPYRLARYAAFTNLWHVLVRLDALEFTGREESATGTLKAEHEPRFMSGGWETVRDERRPRRRYYRLTDVGLELPVGVWCNPRLYLTTRQEVERGEIEEVRYGIVRTIRLGLPATMLPVLPPVVVVVTAGMLRRMMVETLALLDPVRKWANELLASGRSIRSVLDFVVAEVERVRDSISSLTLRRVSDGEEILRELEIVRRRLDVLTIALGREGIQLCVEMSARPGNTADDVRACLEEIRGYRVIVGDRLLALAFGVPAPEVVARSTLAEVERLVLPFRNEILLVLRPAFIAARDGNYEQSRDQGERALFRIREVLNDAATKFLGIPVKPLVAHARALWFVSLLSQLATALAEVTALWNTLIFEVRAPTDEERARGTVLRELIQLVLRRLE